MGDEQFKEREKERKRMENLMNSIELNGGVNIVRALVILAYTIHFNNLFRIYLHLVV